MSIVNCQHVVGSPRPKVEHLPTPLHECGLKHHHLFMMNTDVF